MVIFQESKKDNPGIQPGYQVGGAAGI